jgi:cytochrome c oxidase subunit 2
VKDAVKFGVIWVILSAILEWCVYLVRHMFYTTATIQAVDGQHAADFIFYVVTPIFAFVVLMLIFGFTQFRRRRNDKGGNSPHQFRTNRAFVGIWIGVSLVVNLFLFVHPTASAMENYWNQSVEYQKSPNLLVVDVYARQWQWMYSYPQYGIANAVNSAGNGELVLPVDRPVQFVLRSYDFNHYYDVEADVIHSFWIPAFGWKTDVIPGETRYEYAYPTELGSTAENQMFRVQCAEVCGPGHPYMYTGMKVVTASQFSAWIQKQKKLQSSS